MKLIKHKRFARIVFFLKLVESEPIVTFYYWMLSDEFVL